jgi:molecular chaperone DnaK (HSP70)
MTNENWFPTLVQFRPEETNENSKWVYASTAEGQRSDYPTTTFYDLKRLIGRRYSEIRDDVEHGRWAFPISCNDNDEIFITVENGDSPSFSIRPSELYTKFLEHLISCADDHFHSPIRDVVVTVPANFSSSQRSETRRCAIAAGLNVLRLINEPTAAALSLISRREDLLHGRMVVFDFGGGTLDVSVLDARSDPIVVLATRGDTSLGGRDFDERIFDVVIAGFDPQNVIREDDEIVSQLRENCVKAKIALSGSLSFSIPAPRVGRRARPPPRQFLRAELETICSDLFDRCPVPVDDALADAHLRAEDIDLVIMVGGSSNIPKVKQMLEDRFPGRVKRDDPRLAVARGAAYFANMIKLGLPSPQVGEEGEFNRVVREICPLSLGIEVERDVMVPMISRGSQIPCESREIVLQMAVFDVNCIVVSVFEGERLIASENHLVRSVRIDGIPPDIPGRQLVTVQLSLDDDGVLHVIGRTSVGLREVELVPFRLQDDVIDELRRLAVMNERAYRASMIVNEKKFKMSTLCQNIRTEMVKKAENKRFQRRVWHSYVSQLKEMLDRWENSEEVPTDEDIRAVKDEFGECFTYAYGGEWRLPDWLTDP